MRDKKVDQWLIGAGGENRYDYKWTQGIFGGEENVLKLNYEDVYRTL